MKNDNEKKVFNEEWFKWEPLGIDLANNYNLEKFSWDFDGLKIILKEQTGDQILQIFFDGQISAMRFADETMRLKLFDGLYEKYGKGFCRSWTFFKVKQSDCLQWLSAQSYEISDVYKIQHYAFIMDEDCVMEVLVSYEPEIKILHSLSTD